MKTPKATTATRDRHSGRDAWCGRRLGVRNSRRAFGLNRLAPNGNGSHLCPGHERLGLFYVKGVRRRAPFCAVCYWLAIATA